jgi:hypothetical protein
LLVDHAADHAELLGVFLAEVRSMRADDSEEAGDNGGHAAKVTGAMGTFKAFCDWALHLHPVIEAGRVDLFDGGNERDCRTSGA